MSNHTPTLRLEGCIKTGHGLQSVFIAYSLFDAMTYAAIHEQSGKSVVIYNLDATNERSHIVYSTKKV